MWSTARATWLALLLLGSAGVAANPNCKGTERCPVWPTEFSAPFGLFDGFPFLIINASSTFYYKFTDTTKAQVIDYHTRCFPFTSFRKLGDKHPCKLYFNTNGIYLASPQTNQPCCKFVADVGPVPPAFLRGYTLVGGEKHFYQIRDLYNQKVDCQLWDGGSGFQYWTVADFNPPSVGPWGHDIKFTDGETGVYWLWGKFNVTAQDDSIFALPGPASQCEKTCPRLLNQALAGLPEVKMWTRSTSSPALLGGSAIARRSGPKPKSWSML